MKTTVQWLEITTSTSHRQLRVWIMGNTQLELVDANKMLHGWKALWC